MQEDVRLQPIADRLRAHADVFRALLVGVAPEQARRKPEPEQWSILEVVNHLADEEVEDFRQRVDIALHRPEAPLPPIDPEGWVASRDYAGRDLAESLARFTREREASVTWRRQLENPDWSRSVTHPRAGVLRAGDFLASWLGHDYLHIRQLCRIHFNHVGVLAPTYSTRYAGGW
jgi:hypothetical protein